MLKKSLLHFVIGGFIPLILLGVIVFAFSSIPMFFVYPHIWAVVSFVLLIAADWVFIAISVSRGQYGQQRASRRLILVILSGFELGIALFISVLWASWFAQTSLPQIPSHGLHIGFTQLVGIVAVVVSPFMLLSWILL